MVANPLRIHDPRSLLPSVAVLAGIVLVLGGIYVAQGLVATIAFSALAAVICRALQRWLRGRGLRPWIAVTVTVVAFVLVIAALFAAFVASLIVLADELSADGGAMADQLRGLGVGIGAVTGVPQDTVPPPDVSALLGVVRSLIAMIAPAVTGLAMAVLIVTYLLLDADRLRGRMLGATSPGVLARYDRLATELVVYIRVRATLGAAAAVADTLLLLVLGVPYAVLWGVVSFLFSFVPNIGFVIALIPPTVLAFTVGGIGPALLVVGGYTAINLAFDYVLQPRVMSSELDISPVVVISCIMVWTFLIGATGALLAVPLTIALRAALVPFPGARWFVALLGPVPGEGAASDDASSVPGPAPEPAEPTILA